MRARASNLEILGASLQPGAGLADQAYEYLRDAILNGQLAPLTPLSAPEVARRLGISRSPAREAIARLAAEGLARLEPRRGAVVAQITLDDLEEIYEVREVLEGLACRLAALALDDTAMKEIDEVVAEHRAAVTVGDVARHMAADQRFHKLVRSIAGNRRLTESLDRLQGEIRVAMNTTHRVAGGMHQALAEHEEIAEALRRRDPVAAEEAGRRHIRRLRQGLHESRQGLQEK